MILLALLSFQGIAQNNKSNTKGALVFGQQLPDLPLGTVIDKNGGLSARFDNKTSFSAFKGKLLIFDFWGRWCAPCIQGLPKMTALQDKFNGQIQIFLVNPYDETTDVVKWLAGPGKKYTAGNLPPIISGNAAKELEGLFPLRGEMGYHAWVDGSGKFILRGIAENTHEKKITAYLNGEKFSFIMDYDRSNTENTAPFFMSAGGDFGSDIRYTSSFSKFVDKPRANPYGGGVDEIIDSVSGTVRISLLNYLVLDMYNFPLRSFLSSSNVLYGAKTAVEISNKALVALDPENLEGNRQLPPLTDEGYRQGKFCYEQVVPVSIPKETRDKMAVEDLNRYFGYELGINGVIADREVSGMLLVVSDQAKFEKSKYKSQGGEEIRKVSLNYFFSGGINDVLRRQDRINYQGSVINDTDYQGEIILNNHVPFGIKTMDELKAFLAEYGLGLISGKKAVKMFVLKDAEQMLSR